MICEAATNMVWGETAELRIIMRLLIPSSDYKERHGHDRDFEADVSRSIAELNCAHRPHPPFSWQRKFYSSFYYIDPFAIHGIRPSISTIARLLL